MEKELATQDYINQQLQKFNVTDAMIAELKEKYMPLTINGIDDKEGYKVVSAARKVMKGYRVDIDKRRKELTSDALKFQRAINEEAKRVTALIEPIEEYLSAQENEIDKAIERIKHEKEIAEANIRMQIALEKKVNYEARVAWLYQVNVRWNAVNFVDGYSEGKIISLSAQEIETMTDSAFDNLISQAEILMEKQRNELAVAREQKEKEDKRIAEELEETRKKLEEQKEKSRLIEERNQALIKATEEREAQERLQAAKEEKLVVMITDDFETKDETDEFSMETRKITQRDKYNILLDFVKSISLQKIFSMGICIDICNSSINVLKTIGETE